MLIRLITSISKEPRQGLGRGFFFNKNRMGKSFTLVEIMIVVAIIALLAAVAIPGLLRARITANESVAQANLKTISTAAETYAASNNENMYPTAESNLTNPSLGPAFLKKTYCGQTVNNYIYDCVWRSNGSGYTINANSTNCNNSGSKNYSIATGAVLAVSACQ